MTEIRAVLEAWRYVKERFDDLLVEERDRSRTTFLYLRMSDVQEVIRDGEAQFAALATASPEPERTTIWYVPDCGYTHLSDDGTIYAVCPDGVKPHAPAAPTVEALTVGIMTAEEYQEAFGEPAAPTVEALTVGIMTAEEYQEAFGEPAAPTVEALRDALIAELGQDHTWWHYIESRLDAIIAAARADERTRLSGVTHFEQDGCEGHP